MIAKLTGTIVHTGLKYAIIDVGGVGYKVYVTDEVIALPVTGKNSEKNATKSPEKSEVSLWTHLAVRDDALDLYGFSSSRELAIFELLITISGIGPKTALGIMNLASAEVLESAIATEDTDHLVKVAGLSRKTAEKIVRELQDKMDDFTATHAPATPAVGRDATVADAIEALKSLGYDHHEAREALKKIDKSITDTGAKVTAALKILGK